MPDLKDGESVEVQGSASRPYVLKNLGGVYSCSCPAWRNQSLPIERRTCKHLRALRSDAAEEARLGNLALQTSTEAPTKAEAPTLLLAETWDSDIDPAGWWLSEKLDGVRAIWDGKQFLSRQGNRFHAPSWFTAGLPLEPLDGELWLGRKRFPRTVSIVRRQDQSDLWKELQFVIFDAPAHDGPFEDRLDIVKLIAQMNRPVHAIAHPHICCEGRQHLMQQLDHVEALGGEGLMLRLPGSLYQAGRSPTLLKVKRFKDGEARVIAHQPGAGRHKGRLGALLVELPTGVRFAVGTGFSDAQRATPPPIGALITFRYQELSDGGVPRFPSFAGVRGDVS
jgi:DNA ligase 1